MKEYGLIGARLSHSFSREIHEKLADYEYNLIELDREQLEKFLKEKAFKAVNVTIPYKQAVIPYLDEMTEAASSIGAVNCVRNDGGRLTGHNTDFDGLKALINHAGLNMAGKKVLILGTGGTSDTANAVCLSMGAVKILKVSRRKSEGAVIYEEAKEKHKDADIIINTTPCGMYPDTAESPIDLSVFDKPEGVIDVIYNPLRSRLVAEGLKRGIKAEGGLYMLVAQAVKASEFFLGREYEESVTERIYRQLLAEKTNIVLSGMPSSGKSTVGRLLADKLSREFVDLDKMVEEKEGRTIGEIFAAEGEEYFRDRETEACVEASAAGGRVIASGGGMILRSQNIRCLRQNGLIFFLDRSLKLLSPTSDRPTAYDGEQMKRRYEERLPLYCKGADFIIKNDGSPEEAAAKILEELK